MLQMLVYFLTILKWQFLNFWNPLSWLIWDGEIASRKLIDYTIEHLSDEIKSHTNNISDNFSSMRTWLITNYGGPSRIVGDIINNLSRKSKPVGGNRKEKFVFCSTITGAIQRLEKLLWVNYIDRAELEACLLSCSMLSSLVRLLPMS